MKKIKITEPGWEGFSGTFGPWQFENGISVRELNELELMRVANLLRAETLDGGNPSSSQQTIDMATIQMDGKMVASPLGDVVVPKTVWTEDELIAIADKGGIVALRAVTDLLGVRANSIPKLIALAVDAQKPAVVEAARE